MIEIHVCREFSTVSKNKFKTYFCNTCKQKNDLKMITL